MKRLAPRSAGAALLATLAVGGCGTDEAPVRIPSFDAGEGPTSAPLVRPDTPGNSLQFNFESDDVVESYASVGGAFRVHFTRMGPNAVPDADEDASGVPDFVEEVGAVYDEVLDFYQGELGFRAPPSDAALSDNGGDERFDVYLVDFAGVGDGHYGRDTCDPTNPEICAGYMVQENDFAGYPYPSTLVGNRVLGSHEFFHAVQGAYDVGQGSVLAEGTAVWATERFDPSLDDFEYFVRGFYENVDRPLDDPLPGPADPYSYGAGIYFQYLEEAHGAGTVRALWEACENGAGGTDDPYWLDVLDGVLQAEAGVTFEESFVGFAGWNLFTDDFAQPQLFYAGGAGYPRVRIDDVEAPYAEEALRAYRASSQYLGLAPAGRAQMTAALVPPADDPTAIEGLHLVIGTEADDVSVMELEDVTAGAVPLDTAGVDRFLVVVVNTATTGDSKRPGLCVGTIEEVAACKASLLEGGAGGGGAGGGDGGDDDGGVPADDGCGCAVPGAPRSAGGAVALCVALAVAARRRWTNGRRRAP